jgi:pimeloyl-ACP methyl ester carboxylesterase
LRDGLELPYVEQGDADGVPVVLLHGWVDSRRCFDRVIAGLPARVHAFAFDQRGHGDAPEASDGYELRAFAGDVGAFMDAVGLDAAVLAGASSGGYVAQRLLEDPIDAAFARALSEGMVARAVPDGVMATLCEENLKAPARVWRGAFEGLLAADPPLDTGRISAPL